MIPKFFRTLDPSGRCPFSVSGEITKETNSLDCPCGDTNCAAQREYVGLVDGLTNGRSTLVYTIVGLVSILTLFVFFTTGGDKLKETILGLEERLTPLQLELEKLEADSKNLKPTKQSVDIAALEKSVADLQRSANTALTNKDENLATQSKTKIRSQINSLRTSIHNIGSPSSGSGAFTVNAKDLTLKLSQLKDDSDSILESFLIQDPTDAQTCDDFLTKVDNGLKRARRLTSSVGTYDDGAETKLLRGNLDRSLKNLESILTELDRFKPPLPVPFDPKDADLVIMAVGDNAADLVAPLVKGWSAGSVHQDADSLLYVYSSNKGRILIKPCTSDEGFAALADGEASIFFSDRSPGHTELGRLGAGVQENRSVAEVVALDALTLLVNPSNKLSEVTLNERLPLPVEAGEVYSNTRRKAEEFKISLQGSSKYSGEDAALKNPNIISLGLYHKEGDNIRAKRLAIRATKETASLKPSPFAIATEDYIYSFRIVAWTKPNPDESTLSLVKFSTSTAGQEIVSQQGYVDLRLTGSQEYVPPEILAALGSAIGSETVSSAIRISTNIRFETGKTNLDLKAQADLERIPRFTFEKYPNYKVVILGFTDSDGGHEINMPLSKERASTVVHELRRSKVEAMSTGLGSMFPVDSNETLDGKSKNRRAEVWVARP